MIVACSLAYFVAACGTCLALVGTEDAVAGHYSTTNDPVLTLWEGESGGLRIRWTDRDLEVVSARPGTPEGFRYSRVAALRRVFDKDMAARQKSADARPPTCSRSVNIQLVAVLGAQVSLRERTTTSCDREAHPSGETRLVTLDFGGGANRGGPPEPRAMVLREVFPERALLAALRANPAIRATFPRRAPKNLGRLLAALVESEPVHDGQRCYVFPHDLLTRFAYDRAGARPTSIEVKLGLPGNGICRENLTELSLRLPTPRSLIQPLTRAASGREGFMATNAPPSAAMGHTVAVWHTPGGSATNSIGGL